jgi:hypothetical protein
MVTVVCWRDQILVEYYKTTAKKLTRNCTRHRVKYEGYISILFAGNERNKNIAAEILEEMRLLSAGPFKGRYVDTSAFMRLAPYINWKKMLRESS